MSPAALDELIAERVRAVPGGIADQIVRLRVCERAPPRGPRARSRGDPGAARPRRCTSISTCAVPRSTATVGVGAPGRRQTLPELVRDYLGGRPLPAELDREAFVRLGGTLMDAVERDLAGA